jgi:hypothetical protein
VRYSRILAGSACAACILCSVGFVALMSSRTVRTAAGLVAHRAIATIYRPEWALIGDSLVERCPWSGLHRLPFAVVNLARGGAVIRQILTQADDARRMGARIVLVGGGTNDLILDRAPASHIAFDFAILMRALEPIPRKIVTLVPYTSSPALNQSHDATNAAIRRIVGEVGADVIDINDAIARDGLLRSDMTDDGVHLNFRGCEAWLAAVEAQSRSDR